MVTARRDRRSTIAAIALTVVAVLPVLVVVATRWGADYLPVGDIAIIDMRVRDVFTADVPLLGPYNRFGWNHPGPLFFFGLAPLSAITGGEPWAVLVSGALLQGLAIVLTALVAWRRGGLILLAGALALVSLSYSATGPTTLLEPWNPNVAFAFFPLFLLLVWDAAAGSRWMLVAATAVGTFLVQTHVGYAPIVAAAVAWLVVIAIRDVQLGKHAARDWMRPGAVSLGVAAVLWLPAIIDQLVSDPGNMRALGAYFTDSETHTTVGLETGAGIFAAQFRLLPPWAGGSDPIDRFSAAVAPASLWWLLLPAALLGVGALCARRSGRGDIARLIAFAAVLAAAAVIGIAGANSPLSPYLFYWRVPIAVLVALAAGVAVVTSLPATAQRRAVGVAAVALAVAVAWGMGRLSWQVADREETAVVFGEPATAMDSVARRLLTQLDDGGLPRAPVVVRVADDALGGLQEALFDALDREDVPVRGDRFRSFQFGDSRTLDASRASALWYVVEDGAQTSLLSAQSGAQVLARTTPLSSDVERELVELQRQLADELVRASQPELIRFLGSPVVAFPLADVDGIDQAAVRRVAQLNARVARSGSCRCAVIAFPVAEPPVFAGQTPTL